MSSIRYRIERTRNRHSRAIYRNGTVIIRLARGLSTAQEQEHVDNLMRRMKKIVVKERTRTTIDPFGPLLGGESSMTVQTSTGHAYTFELHAADTTRARRTDSGWSIAVSPHVRRRTLHRFLWNLLSKAEEPHVLEMVQEINHASLRTPFRRFRLGYASTQWGSCSSRSVIMINTSLLFTPKELLRYVIIHKLTHTRVRNHSAAYWSVVESFEPKYKELRTSLLKFRITLL